MLFYPLTGSADSAAGPTPRFVGDLWYCTVAGSGYLASTLYEHTGTAWRAVNATKELGAATVTSSQSVTATATPGTDLTGMTVTATPDGIHPVYVDVFEPAVQAGTSGVNQQIAIQKDGVVVALATLAPSNALPHPVFMRYRDPAPTNASHIYKVSAWSNSANTITFSTAATEPALITATQVQN